MKLFVKGLAENTNGEHLRILFSQFGEVLEAKVVYDKVTRESRGFAFVDLEDEIACKKAIIALDGEEFMGSELEIKEADDRPRKNDAGGRW
jgi:RNA recognition motif-containing protein